MLTHKEKIGFIGLGKLGMPCAEAIGNKGFDVAGFDIEKKTSQKTATSMAATATVRRVVQRRKNVIVICPRFGNSKLMINIITG